MKRGDVIVAVFAREFGKPRPSLIVQSDSFADLNTLVICPLTSDLQGNWPLRILIEPSPTNGLRQTSHVMIDKIAAITHEHRREKIGEITAEEMDEVSQQLGLVLGLTN